MFQTLKTHSEIRMHNDYLHLPTHILPLISLMLSTPSRSLFVNTLYRISLILVVTGVKQSVDTKDRTLKCGFCDKMFFHTSTLRKHERAHQPEKFRIKCRVENCSMFTGRDKQLSHEKTCIRLALDNEVEVAVELMEDLKKGTRSTAESLGGQMKKLLKDRRGRSQNEGCATNAKSGLQRAATSTIRSCTHGVPCVRRKPGGNTPSNRN